MTADLDTLWRTFHRGVYGYLYRLTRDHDLADDLRSRTFLRAATATANGNGCQSDDPRGWIYTIAHSAANDHFRALRRSGVMNDLDALPDEVSPEPSPQECVERTILRERLDRALLRLTDTQREVIVLRLAGYRNVDIAVILDIPEVAVKQRYLRAGGACGCCATARLHGGDSMNKPILLDTFCKAGGCTKGYQRAGFYVVGADIEPQPHYCGDEFIQADALEYLATADLSRYVAIHASPPCQAYSEATPMAHRANHPDLIAPVRELLQATGKPYVIENVESARAHLIEPVKLCGSMFGLHLWRHRYFEIWPRPFALLPPCAHKHAVVPALIDGDMRNVQTPVLCTGGGDGQRAARRTHRPRQPVKEIRWAMEIDWMTQSELTEAIPPAYTEWIGQHLMQAITERAL